MYYLLWIRKTSFPAVEYKYDTWVYSWLKCYNGIFIFVRLQIPSSSNTRNLFLKHGSAFKTTFQIAHTMEWKTGCSCRPSVVWTSLGPLPRWVPGPTTQWAPGTTRLVPHGTWWRGAQGLRWRSTRIGSYTYPVLCRELLTYPTSTLYSNRLVTLPPGLYKARQGPFPLSYASSCKHTQSIQSYAAYRT
jgi:hypothetical protein